jgi:hypothetical protein
MRPSKSRTVMASCESRTTTASRDCLWAFRKASRVRTDSVISTKAITTPSMEFSRVR